uniref:Serine protease inhibitor 28Dc-like n=1 Tax=Diabrotica virgifera virgifera TaxID=50390 RepID=A0A6P7GCF9_DIAVI
MARLTPAIILLSLSTLVAAQLDSSIHFPGDSSFPASSLQQAVGSPYENYVDLVIARGINKLCLEINQKYQETNGLIKVDNTVFSPINIAGALALLLLGSNGQTFKELATVLGLATGLDIENNSERVHEHLGQILRRIEERPYSVGEDEQQINFANAIFVQESFPIRKIYKETADSLYKFEIFNLNFEREPVKAQKYVNAWVSDRTVGKIKDILSEPPLPSTKIILASAMYFKAKWEIPFLGEGVTQRRRFYPNGRKSPSEFDVESMSNAGEFPYLKDTRLGCEILGLPYKGNKTVFYIIMPFESSVQKLKDFQNRIREADLESLADRTVYRKALVSFPKMTVESTLDLNPILTKLNVRSLFDPESAQLGLISPTTANIRTTQLRPVPQGTAQLNPLRPFPSNPNNVIIFNRSGQPGNCSNTFGNTNNTTPCKDRMEDTKGEAKVINKTGDKIGSRVARNISNRKTKRTIMRSGENIDNLRHLLDQQPAYNSYQNPGLYADRIIHKIFLQITEEGTEAAATTAVLLIKSYSSISFRVDVPFIFFMRHEDTKTILFWGSVERPTPYFNTSSQISNMPNRRPFYPNGRKSPSEFEVEMMAVGAEFPYFRDSKLGCEILGLPYKGNKTVFYIIMPFDSSVQKLKEFEDRITEMDLETLAEKAIYKKALVSFPKMTLESTLNMKSVLAKLNITNLFNPVTANLGLISAGPDNIPFKRNPHEKSEINPLTPNQDPDDVIIFNKSGNPVNCSGIFDNSTNITTCEETVVDAKGEHKVIYKKFGDKIGRRIEKSMSNEKPIKNSRKPFSNSRDTIDNLRHLINKQSADNNYLNPGLYADKVIHKVFLQVTEAGTEAAATTIVALPRSYSSIGFRVDVPFIFFMRHESTKTILFWGSVEKPTPYFKTSS